MKVSTSLPFQLIYSLLQHEYLGYIFEAYVVQLDGSRKLTLKHQHITSQIAEEFASGLDATDFTLLKLIDSIQQEHIVKKFYNKKVYPNDFFLKVYNKEKGDQPLQDTIAQYVELKKAEILQQLHNKVVFEMGNDGEPTWKQIYLAPQKATVLFHFMRNEEDTHYFPTIRYNGVKIDFQFKNAIIICNSPAWMLVGNTLYSFEKEVDGNKLKPFLNKRFIMIPKKVEDTYYEKFVTQVIASFDVHAKGFIITNENYEPYPVITFSAATIQARPLSIFKEATCDIIEQEQAEIIFGLAFQYGNFTFNADNRAPAHVKMEKQNSTFVFHKVKRALVWEKNVATHLKSLGIDFRHGKALVAKDHCFMWLAEHKDLLIQKGYVIKQNIKDEKQYFLGQSFISVEITENRDWFDIQAVIRFGEFEIPFLQLRKYILKRKKEFTLPNGQIAVIPEAWFSKYAELFASVDDEFSKPIQLKKFHVGIVQDLQSSKDAKVTISEKLERLKDFHEMEDYPTPQFFNGELRPYQKAGYNWMQFLNNYNFGGCLADDMGLGKTVQTLAMLQYQKESGAKNASLLVLPTSLLYNWEAEAKRFTPKLKFLNYTGVHRIKDPSRFQDYDLILTSYGITRIDTEYLCQYYFNYIILDESQAIKNPESHTSRSVKELRSRNKLVLTGTPIENSTLDLWSQMNFINPGLLGTQEGFRNEYLYDIEKRHNEQKIKKLYSITKPFILRRHKSQVARELPEKVESIQYCTMTSAQEEAYDKVRSSFRNQLLESIEEKGIGKSHLLLLQGLSKLRQIANHPKMVDDTYDDGSGKFDDILHMLQNALVNNHKILVFSQYVKHLSLLRTQLDRDKIKYAYLDGSTKNRQAEVEKFQEQPQLQVFLISLKAGGLGLNLTAADYVFLLDPWWNPAIEAQAVDRAHRIGQKNQVFTYKFITKNSVEEKILNLQKFKLQLANNLITTEDSFVKNLSKEDIYSIFEK